MTDQKPEIVNIDAPKEGLELTDMKPVEGSSTPPNQVSPSPNIKVSFFFISNINLIL